MKRISCLILCIALLLPMLFVRINAESPEFCDVQINAGETPYTETAIVSNGELYIPATHFSRYTRYCFDEETNTFLIDGQKANKAFRKVMINPDTKRLAVGTHLVDLTDCYTWEGTVYLPLCQILPILNAEIIAAGDGEIFVSNSALSLTELLYDFDLHDYYFNLYKEFESDKVEKDKWLLFGYVMPSYLFDSITNFRFDRLDFFVDSGTFADYRSIFSSYLKDDRLFRKAFEQIDDPRTILNLVTGLNEETKKLYDLVDWFRKLEDLELDEGSPLAYDKLIQFIQGSEKLPRYQDDMVAVLNGMHEDAAGVSVADVFELIDYIYTCYNHVEDNHVMLDAVYDISSGGNYKDPQFRAAKEVYDLYGENVVLALSERIGGEWIKKLIEETTIGKKLAIYELTAKVSGDVWELIIPGDTEDISKLTLHAGIANTALMKAAAGNLDTEKDVENYRLSLLLMMIASRKCYSIMADTAEGYKQNAEYYRAKVQKLENMIMGLYLLADNIRFEAYENFALLAEQNRKILENAEFFTKLLTSIPGESITADESVYMEFLAQNPVYNYYALLDINQDGCMELLAMEQMYAEGHNVDLWIYTGESFYLGWEDIWSASGDLTYNKKNRWLESENIDPYANGMFFYFLGDSGTVSETSFTDSIYSGKWYNGQKVKDEDTLREWEALTRRYRPETSTPIDFQPVSAEEMSTGESEKEVYFDFLRENLYIDFIVNEKIREACQESCGHQYYTFHDLDHNGVEDLILWLGCSGADGEVMTFTIRDGVLCYTGSASCDGLGTAISGSDHDTGIILSQYDGYRQYSEAFRLKNGVLTLIGIDVEIPSSWYLLDWVGSLPLQDR